jgi:hypothetical protein
VVVADTAEGVAGAGMAVGAVDFTAEAVGLLGFTAGVVAGMAEVAGFMDLPPMVARPTLVMGGVVTAFRLTAFMDMDLVATP